MMSEITDQILTNMLSKVARYVILTHLTLQHFGFAFLLQSTVFLL